MIDYYSRYLLACYLATSYRATEALAQVSIPLYSYRNQKEAVSTKENPMANLAATLKEEIQRLARKEIKAQTGTTRQAVAQYRREIAKLKRQLHEQEKKISFLQKQEQKRLGQPQAAEESAGDVRFSAKSVRAQRSRLGLSAKDYGKLVGVSPLTIYNWEQGKTRPQKAQLASLAAVRGIGKREALVKLELLKAEEEKAARKPGEKARKKAKRK